MKKHLLFLLILLSVHSFCQKTDTVDLKPLFGDYVGGFLLYDINTDSYIKYNPNQCATRFSPASTFKIPNSLIGLETGVIEDTASVFKYDSLLHPKDSVRLATEPFKHWYEDLSLKMAFKYSCVWCYQDLARREGEERIRKYMNDMQYGNMDISSGLESFWLCGSMEISINEQVEFLRRMYLYELNGFSAKTIDAVKSIMLFETTPDYKLYGKTGSGDCYGDKWIGWYVGFVETESGTKIFALNLLGDDKIIKMNFRQELAKRIMSKLGAIKL